MKTLPSFTEGRVATSSRVYIRVARPQDKEAVFRFCQNTWDWGDYVPQVWDRWLNEPEGRLLVATKQRQPIALVHWLMVRPGEAWLEGMRVDPAHRQAGLATSLTQRCLKEAARSGARIVRLATSSRNTPIHRMAARLGFTRVAVLQPLRAEARREKGPRLYRPGLSLLPRLLPLIQGSATLAAMGGLYSSGWRFHSLSPDELKARLRQGMVRMAGTPEDMKALAMIEMGSPWEGMAISYADGQPEALTVLALGLRAEAARLEVPLVSARLPDVPQVQGAFRNAGYQPSSDYPFWIYELSLEGDNTQSEPGNTRGASRPPSGQRPGR
mgnify:CR=1 FL=1